MKPWAPQEEGSEENEHHEVDANKATKFKLITGSQVRFFRREGLVVQSGQSSIRRLVALTTRPSRVRTLERANEFRRRKIPPGVFIALNCPDTRGFQCELFAIFSSLHIAFSSVF
ncbi:hypothetical protein D8B26_002903 [Coccidioides posadasii str. Silveira]|uniref:uncharacterized protein n=1 Tax=Coccidioides posadasii (strain RMSCC 757 / Silveira) TaxID=443226 RepID=UPI001BF01D3B|nr:hypothetical protein D8B26_002903 [Coccidioides posadasii str. Silveira]